MVVLCWDKSGIGGSGLAPFNGIPYGPSKCKTNGISTPAGGVPA